MLLLLLACSAPKTTPATTPPALDLQDALDDAVADNDGSGGGLLVVDSQDYGVIWRGESGEVERGEGTEMTSDMAFEVASITKTVTAATALLLVEDGLLDLDAPIGDVLPTSVTDRLMMVRGWNYAPTLTARQLLRQTSGLPDYWSDPPYVSPGVNAFLADFLDDEDRYWEPEEVLAYVPELTVSSVPDVSWHYSDTNYVLLGLLIEEITGMPLHDAMRARVFDPLGMDDTWMSFHEDPVGDAVLSHRYEGRMDISVLTRQSADWSGGGLVSTAADLSSFIRALAEDRLFADPATGAMMQESVPTDWGADVNYGLGIIQVSLTDELGTLWGHEGYGGSFMYVWPEQRMVFVGTLNQSDNDPWGLIEEAVVQVAAQRP